MKPLKGMLLLSLTLVNTFPAVFVLFCNFKQVKIFITLILCGSVFARVVVALESPRLGFTDHLLKLEIRNSALCSSAVKMIRCSLVSTSVPLEIYSSFFLTCHVHGFFTRGNRVGS